MIFKKHKVIQYFTNNPDVKAACVERFNRTLKTKMYKYFTHYNTRRYVDVSPKLLNSYNNAIHSTIKIAPANVKPENVLTVWQNMQKSSKQSPLRRRVKFKIGDYVRISREKMGFEKGYENNFSEEIFKIVKILQRQPTVFVLQDLDGEDIEGTFYAQELQKVRRVHSKLFKINKILASKGKGRSRKVLVNWRGYPAKFNSWLSASELKTLR